MKKFVLLLFVGALTLGACSTTKTSTSPTTSIDSSNSSGTELANIASWSTHTTVLAELLAPYVNDGTWTQNQAICIGTYVMKHLYFGNSTQTNSVVMAAGRYCGVI